MLYWECKRRLVLLSDFKRLGANYFGSLSPPGLGSLRPVENDTAQRARHQINLILPEVIRSFDLIGAVRTAYYSPPPAFGGYAGPLDFLANFFDLWRFQIDPQTVADLTDRAIGDYQRMMRKAYRKLFNPLFWVSLALIWLLSSFLQLFSRNWDVARVARSFVGRLIKFIVNLATFLVAVLGILDYMGWLNRLKDLLRIAHK
jgi:hypothetical protein